MYEWYEVLKDGVVKDSEGHTYKIGDNIELDENRTNTLLESIAKYENDGALIRQGSDIKPRPFPEPVKPKPPAGE